MRRLLALFAALGFVSFSSLAAAESAAAVGNVPSAGPPARTGFQAAFRTGFSLPFGDATGVPSDTLGRRYAWQVPVAVGFGAEGGDTEVFDLRALVGLGPYAELALGRFNKVTTEQNGHKVFSGAIDDRALHAWLTLGLRMVVRPSILQKSRRSARRSPRSAVARMLGAP